jgi:hypothetical protein
LSPARLAEELGGLAFVAVVLADVFRSVVLPRPSPRTLRFGPWVAIAAMRVALRWARGRTVTLRHEVLGALGPLLIVVEMLIWVAALILGFGLMLDGLRASLKGVSTFGDAAYLAASAMFTLGLPPGGFDATGPARLVIAVAALSGLAVVTLTVTFLLAIQGALTQRESLVLRLRARTGPHPSGLALLLAHARLGEEHGPALVEFFEQWEQWSAAVLLTHRAFPILCYFRSTDADCEWLAALGATLDAAALLAALGAEGMTEHAALCHRVGARLAADLARQFGLHPAWDPNVGEDQFQDAAAQLRTLGFGTRADPAAAWERFSLLRAGYAPPLLALCERFGISGPVWGVTAPYPAVLRSASSTAPSVSTWGNTAGAPSGEAGNTR